ncbi:MAG: HlyC/CorC family transporter [Oscillospiraceae bacterium]|nr:HlyC/CorC family transporter [Oscillospiraceae bacterium]
MLLLQLILIALNAVFACAEVAVISMNDNRLERLASQGDKRALRLRRLTSQPARFLATIQVAITLSGFIGSAFAAENFSDVLVDGLLRLGVNISRSTLDAIAVVVITLILSYFTLIFGELVPKRLAQRKAEPLALGLSGLIGAIAALFAPVVWFLTFSTNAVLRLIGVDPHQNDDEVSEEEIRMMVDVGSEKGAIDPTEKEFIQNVFEFDDLSAAEIATHRTEVALLWLEESMDVWAHTIHSTRHTLYPICQDSADRVVGILNARDYFRLEDKTRKSVLAAAVQAPYFVPGSIRADVLFRNMKRKGERMSVVLDEHGGMVGIVTLNDLVEQLVGTLDREDSAAGEQLPIQKLSEDSWRLRGNIELCDLEEVAGSVFENSEHDTITGLVFHALGYVPEDGACDLELDVGPVHVRVLKIQDHQIAEATLHYERPEEE